VSDGLAGRHDQVVVIDLALEQGREGVNPSRFGVL